MLTSATAERMAASSSGEGVNACRYLFGQSFFGCLQMDMITSHGTRTCIKRKKIDYGNFLYFRASKKAKMNHFWRFGGTENGTSGARIKILRPLFNTNTPPKTPI